MGGWYWIGVIVGAGVALGILGAGIAPRWIFAAVPAALAGAAIGFAVFGWYDAIGGLLGGLAGALGGVPIVAGALRRGGTRLGLAVLVGLAALLTAAFAFVPLVGYLEAVALPAVGLRLRRREPERHAGLRTLARD